MPDPEPPKTIFADTPVAFEIAPGRAVDGAVYMQMPYGDKIFYILKYFAGEEEAFVVRLPEQFRVTGL
jgi:hypothetical protein